MAFDDSREDVIVLDDDQMIHKIIQSATRKNTRSFSSTKELLDEVENLDPLAVFVDIHLGAQDNGLDILPKLKDYWPFCPIIVITGDKNENSIGNALASGADDFIYKPINAKELIARMQARLEELNRREAKEIITIGDVTVDKSHRVITNSSTQEQRYLSPTEMSLLTCLLNAKGTVVRRDSMKRKCWGQVYVSDNALNRKLHEVRRALKEISDSVNIRTIYGTGFIIEIKNKSEQPKNIINI